jgi:hypothetical protein
VIITGSYDSQLYRNGERHWVLNNVKTVCTYTVRHLYRSTQKYYMLIFATTCTFCLPSNGKVYISKHPTHEVRGKGWHFFFHRGRADPSPDNFSKAGNLILPLVGWKVSHLRNKVERRGFKHTAMAIPFIYSFSGNSAASAPISTVMCLQAIYIFPGSVYIFPPAEQADPSW